jgi:hypothetical protein
MFLASKSIFVNSRKLGTAAVRCCTTFMQDDGSVAAGYAQAYWLWSRPNGNALQHILTAIHLRNGQLTTEPTLSSRIREGSSSHPKIVVSIHASRRWLEYRDN